jgi:hypothetical protein
MLAISQPSGSAVTSACVLPQTLTSHDFSPPGITAFSSATPPKQRRKRKPKDYRLANLGEVMRAAGVTGTPGSILTWLVTRRQWRKDRLMIVGYGELAEKFSIHQRTAIRSVQALVTANCLKVIKRGGSPLGQRKEANIYALGSLFDLNPHKDFLQSKLVTNLSVVAPPTSDKSVRRLVTKMSPSPNSSPNINKHTHTKDSPSASPTLEQWTAESLRLNPSRDLKDVEYCFQKAVLEGLNGNWKSQCLKYHRHYRPITPAKVAPVGRNYSKASSPSPKSQPSSCESRRAAPLDYLNLDTLVRLITTAKREGTSLEMIKASIPAECREALWKKAQHASKPKSIAQINYYDREPWDYFVDQGYGTADDWIAAGRPSNSDLKYFERGGADCPERLKKFIQGVKKESKA